MRIRNIISLFIAFFIMSIPAFSRENTVHNFGPDTGPRLVFTTPNQTDQSAMSQLERLSAELGSNQPAIGVSVIITENDYRVLPGDIDTGYPEGTRAVASLLSENESGAVIIVKPGKAGSITVKCGIAGETSPRWLLTAVTGNLERQSTPWKLEETRLPLYRIGWIPEDDLLATYMRAGIPAILVETGDDLGETLPGIVKSLEGGIPATKDRHYLLAPVGGKIRSVGESFIAFSIVVALAVILFFLFFFSFLFGKTSDQHLGDLGKVWWVPFLYLAANLAALHAGQSLVALLSHFRFGTVEAWTLFPRIAFSAKLLAACFFITLIVSFRQLIRFPQDSFIYGYLASISCMVNLFYFSSQEFSLAPLFLCAYLVSFFAYHFRSIPGQIAGIILLALPFYPYGVALFAGGSFSLGALINGTGHWNVSLALFFMPFQLMLSRLFHMIGSSDRHIRTRVPANLALTGIFALASLAILLFRPVWSAQKPVEIGIRETINERGNSVTLSSPVKLRDLEAMPDPSRAAASDIAKTPEAFIGIHAESRKFFERQLVNVTVTPSIPVDRLELVITSTNGISVYDASVPFELRNGGRDSVFEAGIEPAMPFAVSLSSDYASALSATVRIWTRTNPYGLAIPANFVKSDFILSVERTIRLPAPGGRP
jgi:hypothetical protein